MARYSLAGVLLVACFLYAQYPPGQSPPIGTYPPGQYPPGQTGRYPPGQYPGGVGTSLPPITIPKRTPKDTGGKTEVKETLQTVEGSLRKLEEKKLALDTPAKGTLQFRLLAKTQFINTDGKARSRELFNPGDHLKISYSMEDEETALLVTLTKPGTDEEREAIATKEAEPPVEPATLDKTTHVSNAPKDNDRPVLRRGKQVHKPSDPEPEPEPEPAKAAAAPKIDPREYKEDPPIATAANPVVDPLIAAARETVEEFSEGLPDFLVQQHTTRYISEVKPTEWRALDIVSADVTVVKGREEYKKITVNGKPVKAGVEKTGAWSTGEFATTQRDILHPSTDAKFVKRGTQRVGGREAVAYDFTVQQPNSHWRIVPSGTSGYRPPYKGVIWIDRESKRVLKIEQRATYFPDGFEFNRADLVLEYGVVRISGRLVLLPVRSENIICEAASNNCSRNEINFRNYRKFGADTSIVFEKD